MKKVSHENVIAAFLRGECARGSALESVASDRARCTWLYSYGLIIAKREDFRKGPKTVWILAPNLCVKPDGSRSTATHRHVGMVRTALALLPTADVVFAGTERRGF